MTRISEDDVRHVARLARLDVTDDEVARFAGQLEAVLQHATDVEALDVGDVPPTAHPLPLQNVLRDDEPRESWPRERVLDGAPDVASGGFRVPTPGQ